MSEEKKSNIKDRIKVKRGRTGTDVPPSMQATEKGLVSKSREAAANSSGRPERVPMHKSQSCNLPEHLMEDGFYYREFLDSPGRLEKALKAGYEFVVDEQGNRYSYPAGDKHHYAMKLPMEFRQEDLAAKARKAADARRTEVD